MDIQKKQYIQGFNSGYILAKYEPDLLKKVITQINPKTDFLVGFFSGKDEYEFEHLRNRANEIRNIRNKSQDHDKTVERE